MKKKNVLVFPCGSEIGLDVYDSVHYSTYFHLIGASSVSDHGQYVYPDYIADVPFITDEQFLPAMKRIVEERQIDAIYPAMDAVLTLIKQNEDYLQCKVITSPLRTTEICLSKSLTYNALRGVIPVPEVFQPTEVATFPVFLKPDVGYGARGTKLVTSREQLLQAVSERSDLLVLEYLPGEEYTVECFTDRNRQLIYSAARKRNRIRSGISVNTFFVDHQEEFCHLTQRINAQMVFQGTWFYQVKRRTDGSLCLLEVAARLGGSSLLSRAKGVNLALMTLFDAFGYQVAVQLNEGYSVTLDRALGNRYLCHGLSYATVYVDYDDCLMLDNTVVNTQLVQFLYQCVNQRKRIVLLSKHRGDLAAKLKAFRLDTLFDEVLHIGEQQQKADFIATTDSIFIDDSFAERQRVKERWHIPVFSPEMVDILIM